MPKTPPPPSTYDLDDQVGYNLRRAYQRHVALFAAAVEGLTPTQFAALSQLYVHGGVSQNRLGRMTAMDSATVKGVVQRLMARDLIVARRDDTDGRLRVLELTQAGRAAFETAHTQALSARDATLAPLSAEEAAQFEALLAKLV